MRDQKRDEEFKGLLENMVGGLNRQVMKDSDWWEKNGPEIYKKNLKELKNEQKRKLIQKTTWFLSIGLVLVIGILFYSNVVKSQTGNMNSSPYNMENSIYNMENSPNNMRNSPYNMNNSPYNLDSKNGVYDNQGNRAGYKVTEPTGVTNYYDNKGNRTGYTPSQR
jgi:hypothetical protein